MTMIEAVGNHLWQSTAFAAIVGLATLAFRRNRADVRHALWLIASVKFVVPVAALVALGHETGLRPAMPVVRHDVTVAIETVSQPFTRRDAASAARATARTSRDLDSLVPLLATIWIAGAVLVLATWRIRWRRVAAIARRATAIDHGRELEALRSIERQAGMTRPIAIVASDASFEPGIFGVLRPVLVWPRPIACCTRW